MSRSLGSRLLTTRPPNQISPSVTSSRPAIIRIVVVLPQPEGPSSTRNSWSAMSRLKLSTATYPPQRLLTFLRRSSAISVSSALDCAGGQAADDAFLEDQNQHEERRDSRDDRRDGIHHLAL